MKKAGYRIINKYGLILWNKIYVETDTALERYNQIVILVISRKWDHGQLSFVYLQFLNLQQWSCAVLVMWTAKVIFNFRKIEQNGFYFIWERMGFEPLESWSRHQLPPENLSIRISQSPEHPQARALPPVSHTLFSDIRNQMIHSLPLHLTLT